MSITKKIKICCEEAYVETIWCKQLLGGLIKELKKGNVTVNASEYGGFEKVGELGFSLPTSDENIGTAPGDIVLYQGDKISLFYGSHSWSYTKLGKIDNVDSNKLKEVLGSGDVTLEFSLK